MLQTDHLILRQPELADLEAIREIMDDEVVYWNSYPNDAAALDGIARAWIHAVRKKPYRESWVICDRSSGEVLGLRTVMSDADDSRLCATGASLGHGSRSRGLGSEELATFINLMKHLGFHQIIASARIDNYRAISLYTKLGFSRLPTIDDAGPESTDAKSTWLALQLPAHAHHCRLR